jgi:hypothetical protein
MRDFQNIAQFVGEGKSYFERSLTEWRYWPELLLRDSEKWIFSPCEAGLFFVSLKTTESPAKRSSDEIVSALRASQWQ